MHIELNIKTVVCAVCGYIGKRRLKRMMHTFPSMPSLLTDQFSRMLPDSSGISVDDSSLDVGHSAFVTLRGPHDVASDRQSLSAELDERRRQLTAQRDEAWAPLDLATIVHSHVPRSAGNGGVYIFLINLLMLYSYFFLRFPRVLLGTSLSCEIT